MKKLYYCLLFLVYNYCVSQNKYILEGKFKNITENRILYLEIYDDYSLNKYSKIDSCIIKHGKFLFSGEINKSSNNAKLFFSNGENFKFILDSGKNIIQIENSPESSNSFNNSKRPATISNEIYSKNESMYKVYFDKYAKYIEIASDNGKLKSDKVFDNVEKITELRNRQMSSLKNYHSSYYSLIFLYETLQINSFRKNPALLLKQFHELDDNIKNDSLGLEFQEVCNKILLADSESTPGRAVPAFNVKTDKGQLFNNTSLLGKPYIIAFSPAVCATYKEYEHKLKALYDLYKENELEVVYFNFDKAKKKCLDYIVTNNLNWINVSDDDSSYNTINQQFNTHSLPLFIVVDKKGNIIYNSDKPVDHSFSKLEKYIKLAIK